MKKYFVLIAAVLIQLCLGASYSWSTFVPALKQNYGFSITQTQTIFGAVSFTITILIFFGGRIQDRIGPRIPSVIGGIIFGVSYILAGFSSGSYPTLFSLIGIGSGIGVGLCYICPIACAMKWFPNHKSLVTGIAVAGYGGSAIIISRLGENLLAQNISLLEIFKYLGVSFLILVTLSALFLENPPQKENTFDSAKIKTIDVLRDRNFWGLFCGIFPCQCIGLMVIGNIKPYGLSLNLSLAAAGVAVSTIAIFNAAGRICWGILGGLVPGKKIILISLASTSLVCLIMPLVINGSTSFQIFATLIGFNYGACLVLYAAEVAHNYGTAQMGTVYSTLFLSNALAAIIGPSLAGWFYDTTGSYTPAFLIFGCLSFAAIFLFYFIYQPGRLRQSRVSQ
jgi:OFA family oxalate/formate antiporter-like MFS transporter